MTTVSTNAAVSASATTAGQAANVVSGGGLLGGQNDDFMAVLEAFIASEGGADNSQAGLGNNSNAATPLVASPNTVAVANKAAGTFNNAVATVATAPTAEPAATSNTATAATATAATATAATVTVDAVAADAVAATVKTDTLPAAIATAVQAPASIIQLSQAAPVLAQIAAQNLPQASITTLPASAMDTTPADSQPVTLQAVPALPDNGKTVAATDIDATVQIIATGSQPVTGTPVAPAEPIETAENVQPALPLAKGPQGWDANVALAQNIAPKPVATPAQDDPATQPASPKSSLDSNALSQAAALTVTATPLVVPVVTPDKNTAVADQSLGAQFSAFTAVPAKSAAATGKNSDVTDADSDDDSDLAADDDSNSPDAAISADAPAVTTPSVQNTAADGFGQGKFSSELTQVLSLVQAGQAKPEKDNSRAAASDDAAPVAGDSTISSTGITLTRQENGQGFATTLAGAAASGTTSQIGYQPPVDQVSVIMQRAAASQQTSSMTIALNPAELGRVEVSLKFAKDGSVQASVLADKAETLNMLKDDQSSLHQALANAGFNSDSNSLSFDLRDNQAQQGQQQNFEGSNSPSTGNQNDAESDNQLVSSAIHYAVQETGNGHLNLFV